MYWVTRLIVPPLPAASRPSNTTTIRAPVLATQSSILTSSSWSRRTSFSYFFFGSLLPRSSVSAWSWCLPPPFDVVSVAMSHLRGPSCHGVTGRAAARGDPAWPTLFRDGLPPNPRAPDRPRPGGLCLRSLERAAATCRPGRRRHGRVVQLPRERAAGGDLRAGPGGRRRPSEARDRPGHARARDAGARPGT